MISIACIKFLLD